MSVNITSMGNFSDLANNKKYEAYLVAKFLVAIVCMDHFINMMVPICLILL